MTRSLSSRSTLFFRVGTHIQRERNSSLSSIDESRMIKKSIDEAPSPEHRTIWSILSLDQEWLVNGQDPHPQHPRSFLGMSYAFRQSGYLTGLVLLGMVAVLTGELRRTTSTRSSMKKTRVKSNCSCLDYSTNILLRSGHMAKVTTYQELVFSVLGKSGFLWLSLVQFLYPFICLISYNIIIGMEQDRASSSLIANHARWYGD